MAWIRVGQVTLLSRVDAIREVGKLLETPEKWCKGSFARDNQDQKIELHRPEAVTFCLFGAIRRVFDSSPILDRTDAMTRTLHTFKKAINETGFIADQSYGYDVSLWNDHPAREHSDILRVCGRAVTIAVDEDKRNAENKTSIDPEAFEP